MAKEITADRVLDQVTVAAEAKVLLVIVVQREPVALVQVMYSELDLILIMLVAEADRATNATLEVLVVELEAQAEVELDQMLQVEAHQGMVVLTQVVAVVARLGRTMQVLLYLDQVDLELL